MLDREHLHRFGKRKRESHKGSYGRVLVLAGSVGFSGAAYLAAGGALRAGAGLVTLGVPESLVDVLAAKLTCAMTRPFPETDGRSFSAAAAGEALAFAAPFDAVALGPGISTHPETVGFVSEIVEKLEKPLVIDADGLNCLATNIDVLLQREHPTVLTPHPGELRRLAGCTAAAGADEAVRNFLADAFGKVFVLKSHRTIVTCGKRVYTNPTGNPGMASGGSGDVLTGIIAAFLGRGIEPFEAAASAVCLHGMAGDVAAERMTEEGMIASDLIGCMGAAWKQYLKIVG